MKTEYLLLAQFDRAIVPLDEICEDFFGCSRHTAIQKAKAGVLGVPAFRNGKSQKATFMVHISDLATMIDNERDKAKADWVGKTAA